MIVVSDTAPIISLLKINQLDLLQKLFGKVMIPGAVYDELISNPRYETEANLIISSEYISRVSVAENESVRLLQRATGGILLQAYQSQFPDKEQILHCIDVMRASGRQISENLYRQLINRLEQ